MTPCGSHRASPTIIAGVLIMALGLILLLDQYGFHEGTALLRYWPLGIVALGITKLLERRQAAGRVWGVVITFLGVVLSFPVLFGRDLEWNKIWPLFVIGWGLALLWGALESRRTRPAIGSDLDSLNQWTIFGGGELQVSSRQFQGGELFAMFGGWNVDLRHADIKDSEATVEVNTICGGATLRVPEGWKVILKGTAIMGGFSDKSRPPRPEDDATAKRLYIRGTALCGGVEIKN